MVDHISALTEGASDWRSNRSVSSCRAAVMMIVQKRKDDTS